MSNRICTFAGVFFAILLLHIGAAAQAVGGGAQAVGGGRIPEPNVRLKSPASVVRLAPADSKLEASFSQPELKAGEVRSFEATAYSLKGITRSGSFVQRGVIAADPRILPLGSVVQVTAGEYTGVYTVEDTGGRIKGNIIDVWVPSYQEAIEFGRRKVKVEVLKVGQRRLRR